MISFAGGGEQRSDCERKGCLLAECKNKQGCSVTQWVLIQIKIPVNGNASVKTLDGI